MRKSDSVKVAMAEAASCLPVSLFLVFRRKRTLQIAKGQVPPRAEIPSPSSPAAPCEPYAKSGPRGGGEAGVLGKTAKKSP